MKLLMIVIHAVCTIQFAISRTNDSNSNPDTTDLRNSSDEEILLEGIISEDEDSRLVEDLESLKRNPLDLNNATGDQLELIPFISSVIARNIVEYRRKNSVFRSKRELLNIDGVSEDLYEKMKMYLIVRQSTRDIIIDEAGRNYEITKVRPDVLKSRLRTKLFRELQPKAGYISEKYSGNNSKVYNQLNMKYFNRNFSLESNLTVEKDPGEKNYFDFVSGFAEIRNFKFIKNLTAGDYSLNFGQGLTMWTGLSFSKGVDAVNPIKRKGKAIDGYSSSSESQFFRGAAASVSMGNYTVCLFYANSFYNASIDTVSGGVKSFYYDGYHRTSSEANRKNSVREKLIGGHLTFEKGSLKIGATHWSGQFSKNVIKDSTKELYNFSGRSAWAAGIDYDCIFRNINMFGEFSMTQSKSVAMVNSVQISFMKFAELIFLYRNYPEDFAPVHSFGFGERNGETRNETGIYSGITLRPTKGLVLNAYYDQYRFPYRTFTNPVPVSGNEYLLNADWKISKELQLNLKLRNECKELSRTTATISNIMERKIDNRSQLNFRTGFLYQVTEKFRLRSRYEYVYVEYENYPGSNKGMMFYSDFRIMPAPGLVFDARIIFFSTDDYDSRIYEFENEVPGAMSNVALYGKGRRWYAVLKYKPFRFLEVSAKYAETFYDGAKSIGSGNDKIRGDVNNKLSLSLEAGF